MQIHINFDFDFDLRPAMCLYVIHCNQPSISHRFYKTSYRQT